MALAEGGAALPQGLADFLNSPFNPAAFGPLVAAVVVTLIGQGWKGLWALLQRGVDLRFKKTWLIPIFLLPPVIFSGGILLSILLGVTEKDFSLLTNLPYALVGFIMILLTGGPLQEEFGWRGVALPHLQARYSPLVSSLVLGVFWWLWHLPIVFIPGRFMTDNLALFLLLGAVLILTSILFTWVYNHTNGSVLAALLLHTSMNWSIWVVLPGMQVNWAIVAAWTALLGVAVFFVIRSWGAARSKMT